MDIKKLITILKCINSDAKKVYNQYMKQGKNVYIILSNDKDMYIVKSIVDFENKFVGVVRLCCESKKMIIRDEKDDIICNDLDKKRCVFSKYENAELCLMLYKIFENSKSEFEELLKRFDNSKLDLYKQNWKNKGS